MSEWILILILENSSLLNGPVLIDGFQTEELCEAAAPVISDEYRLLAPNTGNLKTSSKCLEIKKSNVVSPRGTSSIKPSQPKGW